MSGEPRGRPAPRERGPQEREPQDEPSGGALAPDPELEQALREAAAAVDARAADPGPAEALLLDEPGAAEVSAEEAARQIEELSARLVESQDRLLRLQADFENFRRRALRERQEAVQYGHQNLVKDLLGVVDNLDRAVEHARNSKGGDFQNLLQGVELVQRELLTGLESHGVTQVEALGRPFDPSLMEAMAQSPDASVAPNSVVDVLQRGYRLRDRLLRPARVVVAVPPESGDAGGGGG